MKEHKKVALVSAFGACFTGGIVSVFKAVDIAERMSREYYDDYSYGVDEQKAAQRMMPIVAAGTAIAMISGLGLVSTLLQD